MSNAMPYVKWHGRDWLGDPMLRMVGHDARGVWIDVLCVMMQGDPYGHLAIAGRSMTDDQVARMIGVDVETYKGILYRLFEAGIPSRTDDGIIYSRRLVRDHALFMSGKKYGTKGGGNPALKSASPSDSLSGEDTRTQNPESKGGLKGTYKGRCSKEEAKQYASEIGFAGWESWFDHFEANGWKVGGKAPMRDWRAAMRNGHRRNGTLNCMAGGSHGRMIPSEVLP